jgi:hypothetical protein
VQAVPGHLGLFHEEKRDLETRLEYLDDHALGYRLINADQEKRHHIVKEIIADPHLPCVLIHTRLEGDEAFLEKLRLHVLLAPHLEGRGWGNSALKVNVAGKDMLAAFRGPIPGMGDISRNPGREKAGGTAEQGYLHCGPNGTGHFVKMVHNGIEYGIMAAYAEGLGVLRAANVGKQSDEVDAETTPLREPENYQYDLDLPDVAEVWRRGSVIASWLLDLTASALLEDPDLKGFAGRVFDSGEGRWTIKAAIDEGVPVPVLTTALYERFSSRGEADYQDKLLSAMRFQFGGHHEKPAG